jgi:putative transposase
MFGKRNRTSSSYIGRALYLYFLGLSTRSVSKAMLFLHKIRRSHVAIWNWIQRYHPKKITSKRKKIEEYIVDETLIKVGTEYIWLWMGYN